MTVTGGQDRGAIKGLTAACLTVCAALAGGGCTNQTNAGPSMYAIRALTTHGRTHYRMSEVYADYMRSADGLDGALVQVTHGSDNSSIYYGRYQRNVNPFTREQTFRPDFTADLQRVRSLVVGRRTERPFSAATVEVLDLPKPRYPQWDLARQDGYWSLQVGVFYETSGLKKPREAAESYCKLLRDQGHEAYLHHGETVSSVCIGVFGKNALRDEKKRHPRTGRQFVGTVFADPRLAALQRKFPHNLENGHKMYDIVRNRTSGEVTKRTARASFVVKIPRADMSGASSRRP